MRSDIKNHVSVAQTLAPAARTATATGTGVDLANYDSAAVVIDVGAVSDDAFSIEIQDSPDDSDWTAVADEFLDGTEPGTLTANTVTVIGYHGIQRYLRVVATDDGTADATFAASVVRAGSRVKPAV